VVKLPEVMMALKCIDFRKINPYVHNGLQIQVRKIGIFEIDATIINIKYKTTVAYVRF